MKQNATDKDSGYVGVFPAWPYANGPRHIGHGASLLAADIIARYNRGIGNEVLMASGTDEHGTPNEIAARKAGVPVRDYVGRMNDIIREDFAALGMSFDRFTRTTVPRHAEVAQELFLNLVNGGYLTKDKMLGSYDSKTGEALPDRYVEGVCPVGGCGKHARGDQCEECGTLLDPSELLDPCSGVTGNPVEFKETEHMFLRLDLLAGKVRAWLNGHAGLRPNAKKMSLEMAKEMQPRPVTRDMDWGVPLPAGLDLDKAEKKVIYVWFEAVVGYLSASIQWAEDQEDRYSWKRWWHNEKSTHYYAMGKDNVPFHTIIWPAILLGVNENSKANYALPGRIASTEYLTMGDGKFSSSRGNVLYLRDMLKVFGQDAVRYYLIAAGPETGDKPFTLEEFVARTNDELIANWGNLVNRSLNVLANDISGEDFDKIDGIDPKLPVDAGLLAAVGDGFGEVGELIREAKFRAALQAAMQRSALVNKYLYDEEPWEKLKGGEADVRRAKRIMHTTAEAVFNTATLLSPFLPASSAKVRNAFGGGGNLYGEFEHAEAEAAGFAYKYLTGDYSDSKGVWNYQKLPKTAGYEKLKPLFRKLDPAESKAELEQFIQTRSVGLAALEGLAR